MNEALEVEVIVPWSGGWERMKRFAVLPTGWLRTPYHAYPINPALWRYVKTKEEKESNGEPRRDS